MAGKAVWIILLCTLLACARVSAGDADDAAVADLIARLSDRALAERDRASAALWLMGKTAEPALRQAMQGDDPEIARRARRILFRFRYGLYPGVPQPVIDLFQQYLTGGNTARLTAINGLSNQGNRGLSVLIGLRHFEQDEHLRITILHAIGSSPHEREGAALLIADGDPAAAGELLKAAADVGERSYRDWAAFLFLHGGIEEAITSTRADAKISPDDRDLVRLTYLHRARGDLTAAAQSADEANDPHLLDMVLIEQGDWQRLLLRYHQRVGSTSDTLGFTAAFSRLAGDSESLESAVAALRTFAEHHPDEYANCAQCLMLNDRVDDGIAILLAHQDYRVAMDFLMNRLRFKDALAVVNTAGTAISPAQQLELRAKAIVALYYIGDRAKAEQMLKDVADANHRQRDLLTWLLLVDAARQLREPETADQFLVAALQSPTLDEYASILARAGLPEDFPAMLWWRVLRLQHSTQPYAQTLDRLRLLAAGKLPAGQVDALAQIAWQEAARRSQFDQARWMQAIGQTLQLLGRHESAEAVFRKYAAAFPTYASLELVGDCEAARGDFVRAANTYEQAWDLDRTHAVSLALRGWAIGKTGDAKQSRGMIELSHLLPLADEGQRTALEECFRAHGLADDARRERELILRTATIDSKLIWEVANANHLCAVEKISHGQYLPAAQDWERAFLRNLQADAPFPDPQMSVSNPVLTHKTRALGLIDKNAAAALAEAKTAMADAPGDADTLIELVTAFEKSGRKPEADALFAGAVKVYVSLCADYPDSGPLHNELAWAEGRCRRNLDDALKHALRAVALEPKNTSSLDTLAEVYFQRGEIAAAVATMETCIKLEPDVARHRERLERMRGTPGGKKV